MTLFGVRHEEDDVDIGEYILRRRPAAVVVETAITAGHGEATGAVFRPDDQGTAQELQRDLRARMIVQLGRRLHGAASPCADPIWQVLTIHLHIHRQRWLHRRQHLTVKETVLVCQVL